LIWEKGHPIPAEAWAAIHQIRDIVLRYIATDRVKSFIFTNELLEGSEEDKALCQKIEFMSQERGSTFIPVRFSFLLRRDLAALLAKTAEAAESWLLLIEDIR